MFLKAKVQIWRKSNVFQYKKSISGENVTFFLYIKMSKSEENVTLCLLLNKKLQSVEIVAFSHICK